MNRLKEQQCVFQYSYQKVIYRHNLSQVNFNVLEQPLKSSSYFIDVGWSYKAFASRRPSRVIIMAFHEYHE